MPGIVVGMGMTMSGARMLTSADFGVPAVGMYVVMMLDVPRTALSFAAALVAILTGGLGWPRCASAVIR